MALDVTGWELVEIGGYWRYVSHSRRLASAGFGTEMAAERNRGGYLETPTALRLMASRYEKLFPTKD